MLAVLAIPPSRFAPRQTGPVLDIDDELFIALDLTEQTVRRLAAGLSDPNLALERVWDLTTIFLRHADFAPPSFERARLLALRVVRSELIDAI